MSPRIDYGPGDDVVCIVDDVEADDADFAPKVGEVYLCTAIEDHGIMCDCGSTLQVWIDPADDQSYCPTVFRKALPSELAALAGGRVAAPRKLEPV